MEPTRRSREKTKTEGRGEDAERSLFTYVYASGRPPRVRGALGAILGERLERVVTRTRKLVIKKYHYSLEDTTVAVFEILDDGGPEEQHGACTFEEQHGACTFETVEDSGR